MTKAVKEEDFLRPLVEQIVQQVLEVEMDETLAAEKSERTPHRLGYRSGYYPRTRVTRVGKLELRVLQDRQGRFRTEVFERYQRSEKALVGALAEMYIQGVSTRKVKEITEQLCGHEFSAATVSRIHQSLDEELAKFANRRLDEFYPYLVLDARYEKVREDGVIRSQAVQVAIGINREGRRGVLGVELANRESVTSWRDFLVKLKQRGLRGVEFAVTVVSTILCKRLSQKSILLFSPAESVQCMNPAPARCAGDAQGGGSPLVGGAGARCVPAPLAGRAACPGVGGTRPPRLAPGGGNGKGGVQIPCCRRLFPAPSRMIGIWPDGYAFGSSFNGSKLPGCGRPIASENGSGPVSTPAPYPIF